MSWMLLRELVQSNLSCCWKEQSKRKSCQMRPVQSRKVQLAPEQVHCMMSWRMKMRVRCRR